MATNLKKSLLLAAALLVASSAIRAGDDEVAPESTSRLAFIKAAPACFAAYAWKGLSQDGEGRCNMYVHCDRVVRIVGLFTLAGLAYKYAPVAYAKAKKMMTGESMTAKRA